MSETTKQADIRHLPGLADAYHQFSEVMAEWAEIDLRHRQMSRDGEAILDKERSRPRQDIPSIEEVLKPLERIRKDYEKASARDRDAAIERYLSECKAKAASDPSMGFFDARELLRIEQDRVSKQLSQVRADLVQLITSHCSMQFPDVDWLRTRAIIHQASQTPLLVAQDGLVSVSIVSGPGNVLVQLNPAEPRTWVNVMVTEQGTD